MKKGTMIIVSLLATTLSQAQDYFINFAGSGASSLVETVKVDNLTSGASLTMNGGDILHLTSTVGIGSPDIGSWALQLFPNPMDGQSTLAIAAPETEIAMIAVADLSGKTVCQVSMMLTSGTHYFRVSGITRGIYFVKVTGKNYRYASKLVSHSLLKNAAGIEHVSSREPLPGNRLKSAASTVEMPYTDGDQLLYKGISGIYSTLVPDVPVGSKTITFTFAACTDGDNHNYSIVQIGTQMWMAENLNAGTRISSPAEQTNNGLVEKYCYNNLESNCDIYGAIYQWNEMMQYATTPGVKGVCPVGWHIPTDAEWTVAGTFLGGDSVAGGKMKSPGTIEAGTGLWRMPNTSATNESGFSALPGGGTASAGNFLNLGEIGFWWTSTLNNPLNARDRWMSNGTGNLISFGSYILQGSSLRCLKN